MKKVGILLGSTNCSKYLYETFSELAQSTQIELFFLVNSSVGIQQGLWWKFKSKLKTNGLIRVIDLVFFKIVTAAERKILSVFSSLVKEHNRILNIDEFNKNDIVYLAPIFSSSGLIVRYPSEDIAKIKSLDLDLIIRGNAPGIFKGDILTSSKKGIISFHHGDNRWNRGGPPGFWEVYFRKPSTGFIIQILTEQLDSGHVIFRGSIPTCRSFLENQTNLYTASNPYLARIILQYTINDRLPTPEKGHHYSAGLLKPPSLAQSVSYLWRTNSLLFALILDRIVLRRKKRWGVAFTDSSWQNANLANGTQIINPSNRFFADPFVVTRNNRTVIFVEDFSFKQMRACISAVEITDNKEYEILGSVIEEPFHMSFPYLFEYEQDLYMIPETRQSNSIRLYKCIEFPLRWEYQKDILEGVAAVDSMIFKHEGKWWLLTNTTTTGNCNFASLLVAYHAADPLSDEWIAHDDNPLVFNSDIGRNGGILDVKSKSPIRGRQKQGFNLYGSSLTLAKITDISPSSFGEQEIGEILPDFFRGIIGCHHIHSNNGYTVYDYVRSENPK